MAVIRYLRLVFLIQCSLLFIVTSDAAVTTDVVLPSVTHHRTTAALDYEWNFFWHKTFANYQTLTNRVGEKLKVPGDWCQIGHDEFGYGVMVTTVVVPAAVGQKMALDVPAICNAYRLYVNGEYVGGVGVFGTNKRSSVPDYQPQILTFTPTSDTLEIAVEVSNFHYREGGINYSISLGLEKDIESQFNSNLLYAAFISGAMMLMFFFFMGFYLVRKTDVTTLYFSLLCLVSALRIMTTGGILIRQLGLPVSWSWLVTIEIGSIILIPVFGVMYLYQLLSETRFRFWISAFNLISSALVLYVVFTNTYYGSLIVPPFRYYVLAQMLFTLFFTLWALITRKQLIMRVAGVGYLIVFAAGLNDILYSSGTVDTFYVLPYAIFLYVIIQAIVMARHIAFAFSKVELLSNKLAEVNKNQEMIIENRTAELHEQSLILQRYNDVKDKIFGIIAHDLRSPIASLSAVITLAEVGNKEDLEDIRYFFKEIKPNVDNLTLTIDNLFVWSQSQINGLAANKTDVALNAEVVKVIALYSLVAKQKEIQVVNQAKDAILVNADAGQLNLILRNLLNNALKFTRKRGRIRVFSERLANGFVAVEIEDDGVGIQPEKLKQLFNPETHFTTYGTSNEKGTGLGLRLCKEYVEVNGGEIGVSSQLSAGTTVRFTLPLSSS